MQSGLLEGGDFIPCGEDKDKKTFAMIGQGARTDEEGIEELIIKNGKETLSFDYIAVVKDSLKDENEMHLDTYFNILAPLKAIVLEERIGIGENISEKRTSRVDIYERTSNGNYKKIDSDMMFSKFLDKTGFKVFPVPEALQRKYGCNFLTLEPNQIIGVDIGAKAEYEAMLQKMNLNGNGTTGMTPEQVMKCHLKMDQMYRSILKEAGINDYGMKLMPFTHLNKAYGGPHCLTQVLSRGIEGVLR